MNRLKKLLMVFALATISYGAIAQADITQEVLKNSVRKYSLGTVNVGTSKYVWTVTTDLAGTIPADDADYDVYTGYEDATPVVIGTPTAGQYCIYIKWLGDAGKKYYVTVTEEDGSTKCFDASANRQIVEVTIKDNDFIADLTWEDSDLANPICAEFTADVDTKKTAINFKLTVSGQRTTAEWKYKYKYILKYEDVEPTDTDWDPVAAIPNAPTPAFSIGGNITFADIQIAEAIQQGAGKAYLWVKAVEVRDGYGTPANVDKSDFTAKAIINQIPVKQSIVLE